MASLDVDASKDPPAAPGPSEAPDTSTTATASKNTETDVDAPPSEGTASAPSARMVQAIDSLEVAFVGFKRELDTLDELLVPGEEVEDWQKRESKFRRLAVAFASAARESERFAGEIQHMEAGRREAVAARQFVERVKARDPRPGAPHDNGIDLGPWPPGTRCRDCGKVTPQEQAYWRRVNTNNGPWHTLCKPCQLVRSPPKKA